MTKENIYDQKIATKKKKIIDICKDDEIPIVAHFNLESTGVITYIPNKHEI